MLFCHTAACAALVQHVPLSMCESSQGWLCNQTVSFVDAPSYACYGCQWQDSKRLGAFAMSDSIEHVNKGEHSVHIATVLLP
jgi:hypothetical protein